MKAQTRPSPRIPTLLAPAGPVVSLVLPIAAAGPASAHGEVGYLDVAYNGAGDAPAAADKPAALPVATMNTVAGD